MTIRGGLALTAPGGGKSAVNIFDSEGGVAVNVASVQSNAGKIEISNGRGDAIVQAGVQKNGRGMVTTGPFEGAGGHPGRGAEPCFNDRRPDEVEVTLTLAALGALCRARLLVEDAALLATLH